MPSDIPFWLIKQTAGDLARSRSALEEIESRLKQGDTRGVATHVRTIRRALHDLDRDVHFVEEFNSGAVQRRGGVR
jgi:hypothetical protein